MKVTDEHRRMTENRDSEVKHKTHPNRTDLRKKKRTDLRLPITKWF